MQIKRYEAKDMTTALRIVKEELGPDAVILSARSLRKSGGIFSSGKSRGVEVTAAIDIGSPQSAHRGGKGMTGLMEPPPNNFGRYPQMMPAPPWSDTAGKAFHKELSPQTRERRRPGATRGPAPAAGWLSALHRQLLSQDVHRELAAALIEEFQRIPGVEGMCGPEEMRSHLKDLLEDMNICFHPVGAFGEKPKLIVFVGPPGVGKTTTLAKLAARQAAGGEAKVGLIGIDGYRIGAVRELQTYADILGLPLAILNNPAALRLTLKKFKTCDAVYLDTAGIGFADRDRLSDLQHALAKIRQKEIHLLLSAHTKERDLVAAIDHFKTLPVTCLGFTKLDATSTHGALINVLSKAGLPLSLMGTGQRIPEDLANGSLDALLDWILHDFEKMEMCATEPDGRHEDRRQDAPARRRYVANRNSDVYHHPECKWTHRIKPGNMLEFASAAEAESKEYLPCRTCSPDGAGLARHASSTRDRVTLTGYR